MAKKKESEDGKYEVGDHIKAKLNDGRIVDATVRAVVNNDGDQKLGGAFISELRRDPGVYTEIGTR
jgi:hypothetical protein